VSTSVLTVLWLVTLTKGSKEYEMTIRVKPRLAECFYASLETGQQVEFDYQVINGEYGERDIDMVIFGPSHSVVKSDSRGSENQHSLDIEEAGDYKVCFDNSFSRISTKTVFFALYISSDVDPPTPTLTDAEDRPWLDPPEMYEMKVEDIKEAMMRVYQHTTRARQLQDRISATMAKDRHVAENNFSKINFFSCVCIGVMIATGVIQVVLLRSLFDDTSKLHKLWGAGQRSY